MLKGQLVAYSDPRLALKRFDYVEDGGRLHADAAPSAPTGLRYGCGIYTFTIG